MKETFTEEDLRYWEECKIKGFAVPFIPAEELIRLWKIHGFGSREILLVLREEHRAWQAQERIKWS